MAFYDASQQHHTANVVIIKEVDLSEADESKHQYIECSCYSTDGEIVWDATAGRSRFRSTLSLEIAIRIVKTTVMERHYGNPKNVKKTAQRHLKITPHRRNWNGMALWWFLYKRISQTIVHMLIRNISELIAPTNVGQITAVGIIVHGTESIRLLKVVDRPKYTMKRFYSKAIVDYIMHTRN